MRKIISLFCRNYGGDNLVRDEVVIGAEWVLAGEGIPTRKWDGTCCMIRGGKLYKRYEVKPSGSGRFYPAGFESACFDEFTGKEQGWLPVGDGPEDRWHREAGVMLNWPVDAVKWQTLTPVDATDGTYELLGPKVQGNPEGFAHHILLPHGKHPLGDDVPRDFAGLREWLRGHPIEGIVWHHEDGRLVKLKAKDFGIKRAKP